MVKEALIAPANMSLIGIPGWIFSVLIPIIGVAVFTYIMAKRIAPLVLAAPDYRFDRIFTRIKNLLKLWLAQWKQPRYRLAGVLHIMIFAGFIVLSVRSTSLVIIGISEDFVLPGLGGTLGHVYNFFKDYAATMVLVACVIAAYRRGIMKPARYAVPEQYGHDHTAEAVFVLGLISLLMLSESCFEASAVAANLQSGLHAEYLAPLSLAWIISKLLLNVSVETLQPIHVVAYYIHDLTFFFFLCFLPLGKHFHVITSFFNVFFMKLDKGTIKPVKWGVEDEQLDDLESFGVKKFEDFTWKHMLDFYSCADCGRCSDQCPANAVGRPLSPRFITIKARDYCFSHFPIKGDFVKREELIGDIYTEDEIWSCTTCGACEEECPLAIEYINKIVDLRRGMVDEGNVPQSLQKPLSALEKRGNPWGKMEKKRADWATDKEFAADCKVKILDGKKDTAKTLFFADSITSYDDRIQEIGRSTARVLTAAGVDFGILGKAEKDSGHEVRRFGEEMLFQDLKDQNTDAILASGAERIVTADPHAFNALIKDYKGLPPVEHISQVIASAINDGKIRLKASEEGNGAVYTYHDPCYLGRHNGIYDIPRDVLDAIPGMNRVEMIKSRDRSFCCGGGGLMLFYEPIEEKRMGQLRVEMAKDAGATVIVTACPFCMVNIEDAIKTSGLEGQMEVIDLVELIDRHLVTE
ncbi:(Fe-S)-binding protein [Desulfonema magnum]|uniref:ETF:quinone oxidoreductase n=1 Tax=Desulfonema magnum TaxID=45655 RepID=A0A975GU09_9BACT|nr:(Fe-S)-binding protein [Desulfonema magnum]QTA93552.1 ETF:quinone oxidoreductase [Desulfonema magnum]